MKNLEEKELKLSIKQNILHALEHKKNPALNIIFYFTGNLESKEVISYFCGYYSYKGVTFNESKVDKNTIIDIIVDNFYYNKFAYISCIKKIGEETCHGHGDYWGTSDFIFTYYRLGEN